MRTLFWSDKCRKKKLLNAMRQLLPSLITRERRGAKAVYVHIAACMLGFIHTRSSQFASICLSHLNLLQTQQKISLIAVKVKLKLYIVKINPHSVFRKIRTEMLLKLWKSIRFLLEIQTQIFVHSFIRFAVRMCRTFEMSPRSLWTVSIHNWYGRSSRRALC